ncbi:hypothetical protein E2562_007146 [Oryza meyeriana var. granulata]|uniref:Uncharacterized protein n=1 Tax=Oryza meyeriana var. granulata TaxID=110450 RepID=A0A6G1CFA8_9ORYZ|nr:hypothetical protein E2562_007146 [Oryza meyeriana var. granulata]
MGDASLRGAYDRGVATSWMEGTQRGGDVLLWGELGRAYGGGARSSRRGVPSDHHMVPSIHRHTLKLLSSSPVAVSSTEHDKNRGPNRMDTWI